MSNVVLAILLALAAFTLLNIGLVLQKKGASALPQVEQQNLVANLRNFLFNRTWMVGLILTAVQYLFYLLALGYGSLSTVTPFTGWGIVVLVLFSTFYLREPISKAEVTCIGVTVVGVVLLGITSPDSQSSLSPAGVNVILAQPVSIALLSIYVAACVGPVIYSWKRQFWHADAILGACSGVANSIAAIFANTLMAYIAMDNLLGSLAAAVGAILFWLFAALTLAGNVVSMVYQQVAYQKGQANLILPLYTTVSTVLPVVSGLLMFHDWDTLAPGLAVLRAVCIGVITAGAGALAYFSAKSQQLRQGTARVGA